MSIEFNWEKLTENADEIEKNVCDFLNNQFQTLPLPGFISALKVTEFKLGSTPPEITLKHFSDPFPEFYAADLELDEEEREKEDEFNSENKPHLSETYSHGDSDPSLSEVDHSVESSVISDTGELEDTVVYHDSMRNADGSSLNYRLVDDNASVSSKDSTSETIEGDKSPFDIQSYIEVKYDGDMQIGISVTLLVNYPAPSFISLPLSIKISQINIHALLVVACIRRRVHIAVMSDLYNKDIVVPAEEVDVIKSMHIESEIGDHSNNGALLRNVEKAENFVVEQLRNVIREELVWPGWLTLEI